MDSIFQSFLLVLISEMGDKTQLLALVLTARFRKPLAIMGGILVATLLNHALASYAGHYISSTVAPEIMKWVLGILFIGFGAWILLPDKDEELKGEGKWGAFLTTTVAFFFAEMGDKTQLATVALGAKFASPFLVTIGTTLGMLGADGLAVYLGHQFTDRIPLALVRKIASVLFFLFGLAIIFGY